MELILDFENEKEKENGGLNRKGEGKEMMNFRTEGREGCSSSPADSGGGRLGVGGKGGSKWGEKEKKEK